MFYRFLGRLEYMRILTVEMSESESERFDLVNIELPTSIFHRVEKTVLVCKQREIRSMTKRSENGFHADMWKISLSFPWRNREKSNEKGCFYTFGYMEGMAIIKMSEKNADLARKLSKRVDKRIFGERFHGVSRNCNCAKRNVVFFTIFFFGT